MRHTILLLWLSILGTTPAGEASRAFINPRISARQIALNQLVQVNFTTLKPQVEGVDAHQVLTNALRQPDVRRRWRLVGDVSATVDKKVGTLEVGYQLLPRSPGLLPLPQIPLKWLPDNTIAEMGTIEVFESIQMGSSQIPIPRENRLIHDYAWGVRLDDVLADLDLEEARVDQATDAMVVEPDPNLELLFHEGRLAAARIHADGLTLKQARNAFMKRWGDPIGEVRTRDGKQVITWMFGWIRIEAHGVPEGSLVYVIQEEIESQLASRQVQRKVFALIEGGDAEGDGDEAEGDTGNADTRVREAAGDDPTRGDETGSDQDDAAAAEQNEPEMDDFIREFERRKREMRKNR